MYFKYNLNSVNKTFERVKTTKALFTGTAPKVLLISVPVLPKLTCFALFSIPRLMISINIR